MSSSTAVIRIGKIIGKICVLERIRTKRDVGKKCGFFEKHTVPDCSWQNKYESKGTSKIPISQLFNELRVIFKRLNFPSFS